MGKVYRTAQGREIDIEKIRLQHEQVPALGNMRVNARGDQLGPGGRVLKTREQIMDEHYRTSRTDPNPSSAKDGPIPTRSPRPKDQPIPTSSKNAAPLQPAPLPKEFQPGTVLADSQSVSQDPAEPKGGLARAIKAAQEGKEKKGIRRI